MRIEVLTRLDPVGAWLRRRGFSSVSRAARRLLQRLFVTSVSVWADGFTLTGPIESRGDLMALSQRRYDPLMISLFTQCLEPGMTVLDLGAQVGYFSLLAARRVGPQGRVFAFEPDPRNYAGLRANVHPNGFERVVRPLRKVVADRCGSATFYLAGSSRSSSLLVRSDRECDGFCTVEVTTIDAMPELQPVDIVKMDIEGAEPRALAGMAQTLRRNPDLVLFVEVNSSALRAAGTSPTAFVNVLCETFDVVSAVDERTRRLVPLKHDASLEDLGPVFNAICSSEGRGPNSLEILRA